MYTILFFVNNGTFRTSSNIIVGHALCLISKPLRSDTSLNNSLIVMVGWYHYSTHYCLYIFYGILANNTSDGYAFTEELPP